MAPQKLVFVTGNVNKLYEVKAILSQGGHPIEIDNQALEVPEVQGTTVDVAMEKARRAAELIDGPCITEDTALAFNALGGLPGPYIKHFMEKLGLEGLNKMLVGFEDNGAEAICTIAYSSAPGTEPMVFEGRTEGRIVQARGTKVFGWDPIFEPAESGGLTFSEMDPQEKNKMSHRYKALEKLRNYLQSQL